MSFHVTPTRGFPNGSGLAIAANTRVKLTGGNLAVAGATDQDIGVMEYNMLAGDARGTVRLRTAQGTTKAIANGVIAVGGDVYTAANGKVIASGSGATGSWYRGIAIGAAAADGDVIEILPMQGNSAHA